MFKNLHRVKHIYKKGGRKEEQKNRERKKEKGNKKEGNEGFF
jgi:hypothetical protein